MQLFSTSFYFCRGFLRTHTCSFLYSRLRFAESKTLPPTKRRPREVDTSQHFCPHAGCDYEGWLGRGNLRSNGHPNGGPWRQCHCTACNGYFPEHHGTIFHGKQASVELIVRVLACLAEGLGIRATARVFAVDPNTVLAIFAQPPKMGSVPLTGTSVRQ